MKALGTMHESAARLIRVNSRSVFLRPNIDLPCPFMEEKHVLDEHETTGLRHGREEPVEDASRHEGLEASSPRAPGGSSQVEK